MDEKLDYAIIVSGILLGLGLVIMGVDTLRRMRIVPAPTVDTEVTESE